MNFFNAADLTSNATSLLGREVGANMQVGLRPEHLIVTDSANAVVEGTLELVENLGEYALCHMLTSSNVEFIAKTEKPPSVAKGSTVSFALKDGLSHFFDVKSGERIN